MSDPLPQALDDVVDGDELAGDIVEAEHDLDVTAFDEEGVGDE